MIVNCTPHAVTVAGKTIAPSGILPRVSEEEAEIGVVEFEGVTIPLVQKTYGEPVGLPEPSPGVFYIVSALVKAACPDRQDLVSPARLVRDEHGRVIGCEALAF